MTKIGNEELMIREYATPDKSKLLEILALNVPEYFHESEVADFSDYLDCEVEKYFVLEVNGEIMGSGGINFENNRKTGKISWDIIHTNFQGLGLGTKLLKYRLNILKEMDSVEVISVRTAQLTYVFYEKFGFVLREIHKDYWAKGFDMYQMEMHKRPT